MTSIHHATAQVNCARAGHVNRVFPAKIAKPESIENKRIFEQTKPDSRCGVDVASGTAEDLQFSTLLIKAQETERCRIAHELHDQIGQALSAVKINLGAIQKYPCELTPRLADSLEILDSILQRVRDLSFDLRPTLLDDIGLEAALRWFGDRQAQRAGFHIRFALDPPSVRLCSDAELACFRIAQEALTNIMRHARAKHVVISLRQEGTVTCLQIQDDGVGFDVHNRDTHLAPGATFGLLGMQERVRLIGGRLQIESVAGQGTSVCAFFSHGV